MSDRLYTEAQVFGQLYRRTDLRGGIAALALEAGIHVNYIYQVLDGKKPLPPRILAVLGFERAPPRYRRVKLPAPPQRKASSPLSEKFDNLRKGEN